MSKGMTAFFNTFARHLMRLFFYTPAVIKRLLMRRLKGLESEVLMMVPDDQFDEYKS
ncbi:MAG TPA: hypothetical protein VK953_02725 [Methylophilus sp.]|nr:hypothetical protein [Methylophilus sp.]